MAKKRSPLSKPPEPLARRADSEQIVAAIVMATLSLGPDAPLADIAARAGVGTASLHRYFPTRAALLAEVSRQTFRTLVEQVRAVTSRSDLDLPQMVETICGLALAGPNVSVEYRRQINLHIPTSWSLEIAERAYREVLDDLADWIGKRVPNPPADLPTRLFVAFSAVRGTVLLSLLYPKLAPPEAELVRILSTTVLATLTQESEHRHAD